MSSGRPVKFETLEEMQNAIDEYFEWCDNRTKKVWIEKTSSEIMVSDPAPYTMSGLARRIGLSRQGLMEYSHKDAFSDAIKDARERIHEDVETRLMDGHAVGPIFNLKNNFGWREEKEKIESITLIYNIHNDNRLLEINESPVKAIGGSPDIIEAGV